VSHRSCMRACISAGVWSSLCGGVHNCHAVILFFPLVAARPEDGFHLDLEDYLMGLLTLTSELVRHKYVTHMTIPPHVYKLIFSPLRHGWQSTVLPLATTHAH